MSSPSLAPPPFDRESADLIFRTCDDVDFRVHKCILAIVSPLHNDAAEAESFVPNTDYKDRAGGAKNRTVIPVTEDSDVLDKLLRFVYPVVPPSLDTLDELKPVLEAALKYQMDRATDVLRKKLVSRKFLDSEPLRVFAIACFHGFEEETRIAAMHACCEDLPGPNARELSSITGSAVRAVWELKDKAVGPASSVASDLAWLEKSEEVNRKWAFFTCTSCPMDCDDSLGGVYPRKWWSSYMTSVQQQLRKKPCGKTVTSASALMAPMQSLVGCKYCGADGRGLADLKAFSELLAARVDATVMQIAATIQFQ
ncbi:hypothetical protein NEOLEDRAFT_1139238 [Neolentinus lepideus HHB14362 ss-1]|uniref:BTB domain-containing protein n=1 Tax=Neolentinus lepideus HHB14362 ss-1 TaxID=1314782 RepID=A0A165PX98_9AGAM|nr:hypothetical protein NEOLEDRAFT_1139238 [Neolentinus lepideus HHB14362 ss-1]